MSYPISEIKSHEATSKPTNRRTAWRMINTVIILLAFFAPWFYACNWNPPLTGFETVQFTGQVAWAVVTDLGNLKESRFDGSDVAFVIVFLGLVSILIYSVLSTFVALRKTQLISKSIWNKLALGLLTIGAIGLSIIIYLKTKYQIEDLLWGYWVTWTGLASCIWLEIRTIFSR